VDQENFGGQLASTFLAVPGVGADDLRGHVRVDRDQPELAVQRQAGNMREALHIHWISH
jgi:hypothetical protein